MLNEQDLMVARALAAESRENSPGSSPGPLRKTPITNLTDKLNTFRHHLRAFEKSSDSKTMLDFHQELQNSVNVKKSYEQKKNRYWKQNHNPNSN
ncbi:hypothetical protein EVAR_102963_1 [Eumeta japonica]|uniref:Uncharacterized protein n=1 Tax=Eumeta variegata TaxID=151549 RepID=A0A4C1UQ96_EUMVA|nr:hypothetical protein EVAR_102963_1 [Eumeta japonica]